MATQFSKTIEKGKPMKLLTNNQHGPTNKMVFGRGILNATAAIVLSATIAIDATAQPIYIDEIDSNMTSEAVSDSLLNTIETELPESQDIKEANPEFLNPVYTPWVTMSESGQVFTTFIDEGASYRNSLGYFTFNDNTFDDLSKQDIDTDGSGVVSFSELDAVNGVNTGWVFPNASETGAGGQLNAGDTVALGGGEFFEVGTNIGFMLVQDGWKGDNIEPETAQMLYSVDFLNPEASALATISTDSSTNSSRHIAIMFADESKSQIIMGFEDLHRTDNLSNTHHYKSDEDFNDAVFIIHANPVTAIRGSNIATANTTSVSEPNSVVLLALGLFGLMLVRRRQTTCN